MPIYEFYCSACHMLLNFFSAKIDTAARPACPRCGRPELERRPARFATLKRSGSAAEGEDEGEEDNPFPGLDEDRLERAMESMSGELQGIGDEEDPRQMARFFRRFGEAAGMRMGPRMEEMLRRLDKGEDVEALEDEMGDVGEGEEGELDEWFQLKESAKRLRQRRPRLDDTLYFL
ncbi:MAG TPA: zinc ribbon domain-containing protein [Thermoanaerobaculia bacterium]|jgi:putative FmdB family regulatory protein|nr:zinc ribbon domain-containing protein [Thermoanaerobaculia bacterium]